MTSKKKLVKGALEHPELYAPSELSFFELWLRKRKEKKDAKKRSKQGDLLPDQAPTIEEHEPESMTVTQNEQGQNNLFAKEPPVYADPTYTESHNVKAERLNGRLAMLGVIAALGAYALTGQIVPGIW
jgi:redox-sensitive bicupin YhaK (pirin superfamily)